MSELLFIGWVDVFGETKYGVLTDKSYPMIYGLGCDSSLSKYASAKGASWIDDHLTTTDDINILTGYFEVIK